MIRSQLILVPFVAILVLAVDSGSFVDKSESSLEGEFPLLRSRRKWGDNAISAWGKRSGRTSPEVDYRDIAVADDDDYYEKRSQFYEMPDVDLKKIRRRLQSLFPLFRGSRSSDQALFSQENQKFKYI